jgi:hypothetical protein
MSCRIVARGKSIPMTNLSGVVEMLKQEHARLTKEIGAISAALSAFGDSYRKGASSGRTISAAGRARIAAAQRARWAKLKAKTKGNKGAAVVTMPKPRTMSAAARKKIAAAQRARWAKVRAQKTA